MTLSSDRLTVKTPHKNYELNYRRKTQFFRMKNLLRFTLCHSQRNIKLVNQLSDKAKINHKRSLLSSIYCEHLLVGNKIEPQWRGNLLQGIMTGPKGVVFFLSFLGLGEGKQSALVVFNLFLQKLK